MARSRYSLVSSYVGRSYLANLAVAFIFFFFIFFVNQILLIAQRILVKNVSLLSVLKLVTLAIPQFLLYTFPFSSLTASAMVIGDFSANNEILALRSSGISLRHVFRPILACSLVVSLVTFLTADVVLPESHNRYRHLYMELMRKLPTLEITSYGSNSIGNQVLANGLASGNSVDDLVLFDSAGQKQVVSAPSASVSMVDPLRFIYALDLDDASLLASTSGDDSLNLAKADRAIFYLDFSQQVPEVATTTPSQLPIHELNNRISQRRIALEQDWEKNDQTMRRLYDTARQADSPSAYNQALDQIDELRSHPPIVFYLQYYRAEKQKKLALSMACFLLVFLTFPLAYLHVRHGRLIGFGVAMLSAVAYWYLLFFAQINIYRTPVNPLFLMWVPDVVMSLAGLVALWRMPK